METKIVDRGRGPQIAGTRITIYDVYAYQKEKWSPSSIAFLFGLRFEQVLCAAAYIEEHQQEVAEQYQKIVDRHAKGNSPEIEEKIKETHKKLLAMAAKNKEVKSGANGHERNSHGQ